jgi:hypothetical protein
VSKSRAVAKVNASVAAAIPGNAILLERLAMMVADGTMHHREFKAPQLGPGVVPRGRRGAVAMDNALSMYSYLNQSEWCGLGFPGYPYLSNLAQRSEYRAPVETIAQEMTREWIKFPGCSEKEQQDLEKAYEQFAIRDCIRQVVEYDGFYGRGQLYISIKGQDSDNKRRLPLLVDDDGATIRKGMLQGFKPVEPIWTTPYAYNSNDATAPDFYKPESWYVIGKQTHASRLLTFISRTVPDVLKPSYNFSGLSLSQLIEPYVVRWLKTVDSVNRLISNFSIIKLATNMQATLQQQPNGDGLFTRLAIFNKARDNRGVFVHDKDSEELDAINVPLASLDKLQAQAQEHMAAPTHIPLVKLTGITPSGLNASSEGEIKVFYDFIAGQQVAVLGAHMKTILRIVQLHLWGKVNDKIGFEWVPLDSPTDKEESEMRKADGDVGAQLIDRGVISQDEERQRLRNNPRSGYTFLKGEAPGVPDEMELAEHEAELTEEGKQKDHERGEESADASQKREQENAAHAAKLDKGNKGKAN